jgi:hypothetical protein
MQLGSLADGTQNIASLSSPKVTPRSNKASQLRSGLQPMTATAVVRDPVAIAAANKARVDAEKVKRRASINMPISLAAPSIVSPLTAELHSHGCTTSSRAAADAVDTPHQQVIATPNWPNISNLGQANNCPCNDYNR